MDEYARRAPAAALRPYFAWYVGYRQRGLAPARHRGLPSPYLTMIFTLDEPLTMAAHPDPGQVPGSFTTLLGGLHTSPALIVHDGAQSGIQLSVKPAGARALLGLPAGELTQIDVPADAVLGPAAKRIHHRLGMARDWPERFAVLDDEFTRLLADCEVPPEVDFAWRLLLRSGGTVPVSELAGQTGWSTRHLANRFREEIGLTPKAAARVIRFSRAKRLLVSAPAGSLADVAASCGYFDQAHLAREFRALAGCPPTQWLAEEFGNIQAGAWDSGENLDYEQ
jgi:AraC-like DNA-binding protein